MICSTSEKNQASYSSDILRVPKESDFREAKKVVTIWVCVTIRDVTIWRLRLELAEQHGCLKINFFFEDFSFFNDFQF